MRKIGEFFRNLFLYIMIGACVVVLVWYGIGKVTELFTGEPSIPEPPSEDTHIFLKNVEQGSCRRLVGNVACTVVFVDDLLSRWTTDAEVEAKKALVDEETRLEGAAKKHGVDLDINYYYLSASVDVNIPISSDDSSWLDAAVKSAGLDPLSSAPAKLEKKYSADEAPIIFVINKEGRSNAHQKYYNTTEYCTVFESDMGSFAHELLHLFGAVDFYYPSEVTLLCEQHLGDSIMNDGKEIDSLTAHIIGWTDEPDEAAEKFLSGSRLVTQATIDREHESETYTGNGTKKTDNGTYTGYMVYGMFNGTGKFVYNSGAVYEGEWRYGDMHGRGKYTYPDGSCYEGEWKENKKHGQGKYTWADGSYYEGPFVEDVRCGYGKTTYTDGSCYEGEFGGGKFNGQGKYTWADGSYYEGAWVEGNKSGKGKQVYADGACYDGDWVADKREGKGKLTFADGSYYEGEFRDGKFNGQGKYVWKTGSSHEGEWSDGKQHGQGRYTSADGRVTVGTWENGKFVK